MLQLHFYSVFCINGNIWLTGYHALTPLSTFKKQHFALNALQQLHHYYQRAVCLFVVFMAVSFICPSCYLIAFKFRHSSVWMSGPEAQGNSSTPTLWLFVQLWEINVALRSIQHGQMWNHLSCCDAACRLPQLYYHHRCFKVYLSLALGICWHGSTHHLCCTGTSSTANVCYTRAH